MKKQIYYVTISLLLILAVLLGGCDIKKKQYEIALVIGYTSVDDKSFNQGSWEGIKQYASENNKTIKYYKRQENGINSSIDTIELAIEGGAKIVICPGFEFEVPVHELQNVYKDVKFVLVDGSPHSVDNSDSTIGQNVMPVIFKGNEAGFMAGYAAVKDGNRNLGFMGGISIPSVISFGFGFLQGVEAAAKELNVNCEVKYTYTGGFDATPEIQSMATSWFAGGTELIFACGGNIGNSIMNAAESANNSSDKMVAKVIGVDVDQYYESDTVITSAIKQIQYCVYSALKDFYDGNFDGGNKHIACIDNNGVGLAMEHSKFNHFSMDDYNSLYNDLKNEKWKIEFDTSTINPEESNMKFTNTSIYYID